MNSDEHTFSEKNADLVTTAKRRLEEHGEHALSATETLLLYNAGILKPTPRGGTDRPFE